MKREREEKKMEMERESMESLKSYRQKLEEIESKLNRERPLLVESVTIDAAKRKANQKSKPRTNQVYTGKEPTEQGQRAGEYSPPELLIRTWIIHVVAAGRRD